MCPLLTVLWGRPNFHSHNPIEQGNKLGKYNWQMVSENISGLERGSSNQTSRRLPRNGGEHVPIGTQSPPAFCHLTIVTLSKVLNRDFQLVELLRKLDPCKPWGTGVPGTCMITVGS